MLTIAILLGLANWIATTILVESELTRPLREWVDRKAYTPPLFGDDVVIAGYQRALLAQLVIPMDVLNGHYSKAWSKVRYLIGCHLCTGTWVALAEACFVTIGVSSGLAGIVLSALVFKAIGHTVLNINARLAP